MNIISMKNFGLLALGLLLLVASATAQYDSTKILQDQNSTGFSWKNTRVRGGFWIPQDTFKLKRSDSNAIAFKSGLIYKYNGYKWVTLGGEGASAITLQNATDAGNSTGNDIYLRGSALGFIDTIRHNQVNIFPPTSIFTTSKAQYLQDAGGTIALTNDITTAIAAIPTKTLQNVTVAGQSTDQDILFAYRTSYLDSTGMVYKAYLRSKDLSANRHLWLPNKDGMLITKTEVDDAINTQGLQQTTNINNVTTNYITTPGLILNKSLDGALVFSESGGNYVTLRSTTSTGSNTQTLQNATGTVALTSDIGKQTDSLSLVTDISSWNKTGYVQIIVQDTIRGGTFIRYNGTFAADNGMVFTDAGSHKWIRKINSDFININWYGATATTTGTYDNRANILSAIAAASNTAILPSPKVKIPASISTKVYYVSDSISIDTKIYLFGEGAASKLRFQSDKNGLIFNYVTSRNSQISDLAVSCYASTDITKNGLTIRDRIIASNVSSNEFGGCGFYMVNSIGNPIAGNSSNSLFTYCHAEQNRLHGYKISGSDANNMSFVLCEAVTNGGLGVSDQSFLGNNYSGFHCASNGSPQVSYQRGLVTLGGHCYAALKDGLIATTPPNTTYWADLGTTWATGYAYVLAYNAGTTYYAVGSWNMDGLNAVALGGTGQNQYSTLTGCYSESDQAPGVIGQRCIAFGGDNGAGYSGPAAWLTANTFGFVTKAAINANDPGTDNTSRAVMDSTGFIVTSNLSQGMKFGWDNATKTGELRQYSSSPGVSSFKVMSTNTTAAMLSRTNLPYSEPIMAYGFLMATPQSRGHLNTFEFANAKPTGTGFDLGDMQLHTYYNYIGDKPDVVSYKRIEKSAGATAQWARNVGFIEYEFQTTTASNYQVCLDYYLSKGIQYDISIFASNSANGDLWSEKRFVVIGGITSTAVTSIKSNETTGTPLKDASLSTATLTPIVNDGSVGLYNIEWRANGIASTTINWHVQIKRSVL